MIAFINHFSFEFRTGIRNKQLLLMNYLFPLGFYLMMGYIMPAINPLFLDRLVPALVVFAILAATLLGLPDPLVKAREDGIFRSYKINGIPAISILVIPAATTILHLVMVAMIITATAPLLFDAPPPANWFNYVLTFLATAVACTGISLLIGVISSSTRITVLWSQLVFIPSMLLGELMIPYNMLPEGAGRISQLLPATQAMNAFNGLVMGAADYAPWGSPWGSVIVLALSGMIALGLSVFMFNWDRHNAAQRGHPLMALLVLLPCVVGIFLL